jgi:hypothetical protein
MYILTRTGFIFFYDPFYNKCNIVFSAIKTNVPPRLESASLRRTRLDKKNNIKIKNHDCVVHEIFRLENILTHRSVLSFSPYNLTRRYEYIYVLIYLCI